MRDDDDRPEGRDDRAEDLPGRGAVAEDAPVGQGDQERRRGDEEQGVDRRGGRQRLVEAEGIARDAGGPDRRDQPPVRQEERAVPAQLAEAERQQEQQCERPAPEADRDRWHVAGQRLPRHEVAAPEERGRDERRLRQGERGPHGAPECGGLPIGIHHLLHNSFRYPGSPYPG